MAIKEYGHDRAVRVRYGRLSARANGRSRIVADPVRAEEIPRSQVASE